MGKTDRRCAGISWEREDMREIKGKYLLVLIAVCGMASTTLGMMTNVAGVFFTPMAAEFGIGRGSAALTLTIGNLAYAVAGMFNRRLVNEGNFKRVVVLGTILLVVSTAAMCVAPNIWMLYALNVIRGAAGGILGTVLVTTIINNWLYVAAGISTSIAMACSGLVGALMSPVLTAIINATSWRTGYLVAAIGIGLLNLPAIIFPLSLTPEKYGLPPLGSTGNTRSAASAAHTDAAGHDRHLFLLLLVYGMVFAGICAIPQHFPGLSESYGIAAAGSVMLSICMIFNTGGKLLMGVIIQRFGTRQAILLSTSLVFLGLLGLALLRGQAAMMVCAALIGFSYSQGSVGVVMATSELFGVKRYSAVYPKISLGTTLGNAGSATLIGFLYDISGGYAITLWLYFGLAALGIVCAMLAYKRGI